MSIGAYIHIPFCSHKCDFCDFAAFAGVDHLEDEYCDIVCREIIDRLESPSLEQPLSRTAHSIFFGGGTPGLVRPGSLERIFLQLRRFIDIADDAEISLETTPRSITNEKLQAWREIGINRLSIGVESFVDSELAAIGRDGSAAEAHTGIELACRSPIENVSCDLMYGLPTQTMDSWKVSIATLLELAGRFPSIRHISAYGLHLSTNSPLYSRFPAASSQYPDDDLYADMYFRLAEMAEEAGFKRYEVSNFAQPGYESIHNRTYWRNQEFLAFGVGAHRYVGAVRSANWRSLKKYMRDWTGDEFREEIDSSTQMKEAIMLGLRMRDGIELSAFEKLYGVNLVERFEREIDELIAARLLESKEGRLMLTTRGVPVSNSVIAKFF